MIENRTKIRVRYAETDQMGIVNNANYPTYYEIGRTELFRQLGLSYKELEDMNIMLPLSDLHVKYHRPAYYDDELTLVTQLKELPKARIRFEYYIYNPREELINEGFTTLAFLNAKTRRPMRLPEEIRNIVESYF
jgi:acyl-CoA thioester hydrolase